MWDGTEYVLVFEIKWGRREEKEKAPEREQLVIPVPNRVKSVVTFIWARVTDIWLGAFEIAHYLENETIIALMFFLELENFSVMIALMPGHKVLN